MMEAVYLGADLAKARAICVFVHGRTQTPEDMQSQVIRHLNTAGVAYALPRQPTKSWYDAKAVDALTGTTREQLTASLDGLEALVASLKAKSSAPILLGGFSQGACLSLEHVFRGGKVDALVALTGCRVGTPACTRPNAPLDHLPTYLTGSDDDPWIPTTAFAQTFEALSLARAHLRAESFPGRAHEVSAAEIVVLDQMFAALAAK
jgi:phospholipase/carboxylesterase